jgi:hypothetical protein
MTERFTYDELAREAERVFELHETSLKKTRKRLGPRALAAKERGVAMWREIARQLRQAADAGESRRSD